MLIQRRAPVQPKLLSVVDTDASLRLCLAAEVCPTDPSLELPELQSVDLTSASNEGDKLRRTMNPMQILTDFQLHNVG